MTTKEMIERIDEIKREMEKMGVKKYKATEIETKNGKWVIDPYAEGGYAENTDLDKALKRALEELEREYCNYAYDYYFG